MVVHSCNPSTWEATAGGSRIVEFKANLCYLVRYYLKLLSLFSHLPPKQVEVEFSGRKHT